MSFLPGYGETPIPGDELEALLPPVRALLGEPVSKAAVFDLEQAIQEDVTEELLTAVLGGDIGIDELMSDYFVRTLHRRLYGDVWAWAGLFRQRELNIGVAPEQIAVELRGALETILYRWRRTDDWTARDLGIAVHAETVRIHPFVDGNGRSTRLLADLVFAAAQEGEPAKLYDWQLDKAHYIGLLRRYDGHRDPRELSDFVRVRAIGE